jgi:hypothetical protein
MRFLKNKTIDDSKNWRRPKGNEYTKPGNRVTNSSGTLEDSNQQEPK